MERPEGCVACVHYTEESDYEMGIAPYPLCDGRPGMDNLKSFPFRKTMPCFRLNFWHSEFAEMVDDSDESMERALAAFRAKYEVAAEKDSVK